MGMDVAMLGGLVLLMLGGVVDIDHAVQGFASTAVLMLGGLFIIAGGLERTGAFQMFAQRLLGHPKTLATAQWRLMVPVSLLSGFMNNTPIVAICLPIVRDWSRRLGLSPSHLFMPLSFAAILGGKLTLIGTATNIIVMEDFIEWWQGDQSIWARDAGFTAPSSLMEFLGVAAIGLPCLIVGLIFISVFSSRVLPVRKKAQDNEQLDARQYQVEFSVEDDSPLVGRSIEAAGLRSLPNLFVSGIERGDLLLPAVDPDTVLKSGDRLFFVGALESVIDLRKIKGLEPHDHQADKIEGTRSNRAVVEAVVSANSPLVGKNVRESRFRTRYNAVILAVHRQGEQIAVKVGDIVLRTGDTLLLETSRDTWQNWTRSDEFLLVSDVPDADPVRHDLAPVALLILASLVAMLIFEPVNRVVAVWACALAMVVTRCIAGSEARRSINWQVLLVIGAALGMGAAVEETGLASMAGNTLAALGSETSLFVVLLVLFLVASIGSQFVTAYAAAALLLPVAMGLAASLGADPTIFTFVLMIGVGCSFITPIGYQTNLMVYGPGGYRFLDFMRLGAPLTIVLAVLCGWLAPVIYG